MHTVSGDLVRARCRSKDSYQQKDRQDWVAWEKETRITLSERPPDETTCDADKTGVTACMLEPH